MSVFLMALYGVAVYVFFLATFLFAIGFVGNLPVPKTVDGGIPGPMAEAVVVNLLLLIVFAAQHSVMARPAFKRWWTRIVPEPIERSTYVVAATLAFALLLWQWQPIPQPMVWNVEQGAAVLAINAAFWLGWTVLLVATFLLDHFELFGLRQVFTLPGGAGVAAPQLSTPFLYRHVRHPIYLGFLIGFWSTPRMSAGHLLLALGSTAYIFVGIYFEERDLVAQFGDRYRRYRDEVGMLLPWPRKAR